MNSPFRDSDSASAAIEQLQPAHWEGRVVATSGRSTEIHGLAHHVSLGERVDLCPGDGRDTRAEIISLRRQVAHVLPFVPPEGLRVGSRVSAAIDGNSAGLAVAGSWLGRVIDPFGRPIDGGPILDRGPRLRPVRGDPPKATGRGRLGPRVSLGVRALDLFATCRHGQRQGLFAAAGVGKSTLLSMLARHSQCDVSVVCLVGERGREVREFLEDELGAAGLASAVVVVATSDASPLMRREAAFAAMTIAEHFRDEGKNVLFLMDSVTRFCHALREIAIAAGESPVSRGYPPNVFAELPRLLERAGPGPGGRDGYGQMTAFFTVLVDGDDHNEPVADSVRGLLDGHIVMDRAIAEQGRFPAINILRSLSRAVPACNSDAENKLSSRARSILATYAEVTDLLRLDAYRKGSDPAVDEALIMAPKIEKLLRQGRDEHSDLREAFERLEHAMKDAREQ